MCFAPDASPPVPPIHGAAIEHRGLRLTAADGNEFRAFEAVGEGGGAAVVVMPDVRGLFSFYEELALRFAERGHDAVAIDYFGRTAETDDRSESFDYMPHVRMTTHDGIKNDVAAAVARLRNGAETRPVFTIGFCFGGSGSWHQAANGHGLSGAIGFYGHPNRDGSPRGASPVISRVGEMECPILGLMGGADPGIPPEEVDAFRAALAAAGVSGEIVTYPGAPHSFFDRTYEQYAAESADAWDRVLRFIAAHS